MRKFGKQVRRLGADRDGSFAVMMGVVAGVVVLSAGFGLNTAQMVMARSNLLNALDSAVTSTARDLTTGKIPESDARQTVAAFLFANGTGGFASEDQLHLDQIVVDRTSTTVRARASVDVDLVFPLFRTASTQRITVESAALYSDRRIEVAMMLDVTGSMGPDNKLRDLKRAASNAVDTLLTGQDLDDPRVRISLIPYANAVNVGALAQGAVFVERTSEDRAGSEPPRNTDPRQVSGGGGRPDNCATERKGRHAHTDAGPDTAMVSRDLLLTQYAENYRSRACPSAALMPLTADADRLKTRIDGFVAEGGTAGHIGIQWAWYTLAPAWGQVYARSERPAAYDSKKVGKYAILMTDGEFNLSYFDAARASEVYNASGKAATRQEAVSLCRAMKDAGIEVFTIGFKLQERNAKRTMADCASPDTASSRHYFETNSGEELNEAFLEIARNIERLALTQ